MLIVFVFLFSSHGFDFIHTPAIHTWSMYGSTMATCNFEAFYTPLLLARARTELELGLSVCTRLFLEKKKLKTETHRSAMGILEEMSFKLGNKKRRNPLSTHIERMN
jgi:hypothetical protein